MTDPTATEGAWPQVADTFAEAFPMTAARAIITAETPDWAETAARVMTGGGNMIKGNDANPATHAAIIDALRGINPHVDNADFDHHGFAAVTAAPDGLTCEMVRMQTIKKRSTAKLPSADWTYHVTPGSPSIKGQHGPK